MLLWQVVQWREVGSELGLMAEHDWVGGNRLVVDTEGIVHSCEENLEARAGLK